ncbi:hypothetical protein CQW23_08010 [Capsicum baccatum]|uniref:O-methyltransferase C-terminal domain-containing protein n=1 Tax=Capsicum baccatum TaxID=33114 RepID=A0A2G2X7S0_CAPBA|nr:hypothetical protein CQW23_08010 [Capsicum baccatum]
MVNIHKCVEQVGGDMFVIVPKADAILMKWICHDWSDDHCIKLLKNCYEALPANGKVIIAECILPEAPDTSAATKSKVHGDIIMLAHNPGGKERNEKEFEALVKGASFRGFHLVRDGLGHHFYEFFGDVVVADLLRTRYALMLWHYGSRKEEEKAQSDDETPVRPLMKIGITKDTEGQDN